MTDAFTPATVERIAEANGEPSWLTDRRREAFARFEALPWPDQSVEEWRHTDIRALDIAAFDPLKRGSWSSPDEKPFRAVADAGSKLQDYLGRAGSSEFEQKLATLSSAFGEIHFAHLPEGRWHLETQHSIEEGGVCFPRTLLVAAPGAEVTFVERFSAPPFDGEALCISSVEIYAGPSSNVNYVALQDWPQSVWHFHIQRAVIEQEATVRSLTATLGAKFSRSVVQSLLDGRGSHAEMLGVYFGDHTQHIDNRTLQLHRAQDTSSDLYYKGALKGSSRAVYSGLVDIEKDAHRADAQQANRNLLLSPDASADPSPFLEIKTSEVARATHGVSVGRPDEQVLFYLQSRGLDAEEAQRLYVRGFFQEVIDRVRVPDVRSVLEKAVEDELEQVG